MENIKLLPEALEVVHKSDEERIAYISKDKWINYPAAQEILDKLEFLKSYEKNKTRTTSILLVGSANNGKTSILKKFVSDNPLYDLYKSNPNRDPEKYYDKHHVFGIPALYVIAPPEANESRLYSHVLDAIAATYKDRDSIARKKYLVEHYLEMLNVEMLIIDEIHNILSGSVAKQRQVMNAIKNLNNSLKIPIVLAGTKDALRAISTDTQISSRFRPVYLKKWVMDKDFISLIATLISTMPLRKESDVVNPKVATEVLKISNGYIGDIIALFKQACLYAIETKSERITIKEIKECNYLSMSNVEKGISLQEI